MASSSSALQSAFNSLFQVELYKKGASSTPLSVAYELVDVTGCQVERDQEKHKYIQDQAKLCLNNTTKYQRGTFFTPILLVLFVRNSKRSNTRIFLTYSFFHRTTTATHGGCPHRTAKRVPRHLLRA